MAADDDSEKTEDPTPKRLEKSRGEGQVLQSQEVKNWGALMGLSLSAIAGGPWIVSNLYPELIPFLQSPHAINVDEGHLQIVLFETLAHVGLWMMPIFFVAIIVAIATNVGVSGLVYSPGKMKPKLSKIDPIKGAKKIVSANSMIELVKDIVKLCIVAAIAFALLTPLLSDVETLPGIETFEILNRMWGLAAAVIVGTTAVLTVLAFFDLFYQQYTYIKGLKMSKQEVKDENKNAEGDPMIKARLKRIRMDRARMRMMAAVPNADVIITNPTHFAVALSYKLEEMGAPVVIAKGVDDVAFRIREVGEEHDVPIVENPPLARALFATVEIDQEIPEEHYKPVAEVIGYVMRLKGNAP